LKKLLLLLFIVISCNFKDVNDSNYIAKLGDEYLSYSDIKNQIPSNTSFQDSLDIASKFIKEWATNKLLIQSAEINLTANEMESIEEKSKKYRNGLILSEYKNKISKNNPDSVVSVDEIKFFYEKNSKNFKLYNEIVQGRYVKLNNKYFNVSEIKRRFKRFSSSDKYFFDSISIQLLNYFFNDSTWINKDLFFNKIPSLEDREIERIVKNNLFYVKEDSLALYLIKINKYKNADDYAPLDYIYDRIRELISNRKRIDYLNKIEKELIEDALAKNIFEKID
tara:strand:+ start:1616 stop:2455 length:840 start_codon:yes stop_codon:yes gene_type:complete